MPLETLRRTDARAHDIHNTVEVLAPPPKASRRSEKDPTVDAAGFWGGLSLREKKKPHGLEPTTSWGLKADPASHKELCTL